MTSKTRNLIILSYFVALVCAVAAIWVTFVDRGYNEIIFADVGQGDSSLIRTRHFENILIDGGNTGSGTYVLSSLMKTKGCKTITAAFVSHMHDDHFVGICELLDDGVKIKTLYVGDRADKIEEFKKLEQLANQHGTEIKTVSKGDRINIDNVLFSVLSTGAGNTVSDDENDNSVVMRCDIGENSVLFTGDATEKCESELDDIMIKDIDILKVGHHGSKTSSSKEFIEKVKPRFALTGVGRDNSYNLPSKEKVAEFAEMKIPVLRTDLDGTVEIRLNENDILDIETYDFDANN